MFMNISILVRIILIIFNKVSLIKLRNTYYSSNQIVKKFIFKQQAKMYFFKTTYVFIFTYLFKENRDQKLKMDIENLTIYIYLKGKRESKGGKLDIFFIDCFSSVLQFYLTSVYNINIVAILLLL